MQLPIDVKAVLDESTNIDAARQVRLSLTVYVDRSAPALLADCVTAAFARESENAQVSVQWVDDDSFFAVRTDDMACLVAGFSSRIGEYAASLREAGVPCMVATNMPTLVGQIAEASGYPVPRGDVVAPDAPVDFVSAAQDAVEGALGRKGAAEAESAPAKEPVAVAAMADAVAEATAEELSGSKSVTVEHEEEPYEMADEVCRSLKLRMGQWIIAACREVRLAFAMAFPFVRRPLAQWIIAACREVRLAFAMAFPFVRRPLALDAVRSTAIQNAGVGVFVFIPGADMPVMTLNQAKMLLMIAAAYGEEPGLARAKELAAVVGGAFACRTIARQLVGVVPGLGWAVKGAIGYVGTEAMGRAAIEYYENGASLGKLEDMAAMAGEKATKAAESALSFAKRGAKRAGKSAPAGVQAQAFSVFDTVRSHSQDIADGVAGVAAGVGAVAGGAAAVAGGVAHAAESVRSVAANRFGSGTKGSVKADSKGQAR